MSHCDGVAISEPNGIARFNLLSIDRGEILVLIVAQYCFL